MNFLQAVEPFGLTEMDIGDNFMVHQKVHFDLKSGKKHNMRGDGQLGDYVTFYAEMDLLVAVSVCPFGDGFSDGSMGENEVRPLRVQVIDPGID